jgi:hypothetical protein
MPKSNFVLHHRSPQQHETALSNSKTSRALASSLPVCLVAKHHCPLRFRDSSLLHTSSQSSSFNCMLPAVVLPSTVSPHPRAASSHHRISIATRICRKTRAATFKRLYRMRSEISASAYASARKRIR